jgi:hypothetical protein
MVQQNVDVNVRVRNKKDIDNLNTSLGKSERALGGLGTAAKVASGALATIGATKAIKSFVDVGRSVQNLQLRFKFLFGSATEGAKAFETLSEFAATVPFSLDQIAAASGNLAVVSEDAAALGDNLQLAGNIAAVTGLDFQTAGEQLQRALSGGIGAADLLREKGVTSLLGFKQGVKVTVEETAAALQKTFGPGGEFGNAAESLAQTFDGVVSMIGDKLFNFQRVVGEEFVGELEEQFGSFNDILAENQQTIDIYARALGITLANATVGVSNALKFVKENADLVKFALQAIVALKLAAYFYRASAAIRATAVSMGILNATMLKNPILKLTVGLVSLGAGFFAAKKGADALDDGLQNVIEQAKAQELKEAIGAIEDAMIIEDPATKQSKELKKRESELQELLKKEEKFLEQMAILGEDALQENLRQEREKIQRLETLRNKDIENYQKYTDLITKVEDIAAKEREEIYKREAEARRRRQEEDIELIKNGKAKDIDLTGKTEEEKKGLVIAAGRDLLQQAAQQNKKAFQAYKALQIAEALIAGKSAVLGAFATGNKIGGPLVGALFAAGAAGYVASQINAIRATEYQGRQRGGPVVPGQDYIVGENGPEMFVPNTPGRIANNQQMGSGQPVNVTFNINTVDAQGFDNLIRARQGTIIGVINQAMNERGRRALT